jgi:hypothetical protein
MADRDRVPTWPHSPLSANILSGDGVATYTSHSQAHLSRGQSQVLTHNGDPGASFLGPHERMDLQSKIGGKRVSPDS